MIINDRSPIPVANRSHLITNLLVILLFLESTLKKYNPDFKSSICKGLVPSEYTLIDCPSELIIGI